MSRSVYLNKHRLIHYVKRLEPSERRANALGVTTLPAVFAGFIRYAPSAVVWRVSGTSVLCLACCHLGQHPLPPNPPCVAHVGSYIQDGYSLTLRRFTGLELPACCCRGLSPDAPALFFRAHPFYITHSAMKTAVRRLVVAMSHGVLHDVYATHTFINS